MRRCARASRLLNILLPSFLEENFIFIHWQNTAAVTALTAGARVQVRSLNIHLQWTRTRPRSFGGYGCTFSLFCRGRAIFENLYHFYTG